MGADPIGNCEETDKKYKTGSQKRNHEKRYTALQYRCSDAPASAQRGASHATPRHRFTDTSPRSLQPGSVTVAPPQPGGTPPAPQGTITFDYRGTDIMNVLKFFAQVSGYNITVDPGLAGQVTIINPRPVTVEEAFKVLQSVLFVRGFTAIRTDSVVSILPMDKGVRGTPTVSTELDKKGRPIIGTGTQVMTQVIPIENVDAEALAKELLPLTSVGASLIGSPGTNTLIITDMPSVIEKIAKLVSVLDKVSSNSLMKTYFLERADASAIAEIINNLYQKLTSRGKGGGAPNNRVCPRPHQGNLMQEEVAPRLSPSLTALRTR